MPDTTTPLRAISLGAGVQSSTLLLMACAGELPKPDLAIFADTQWEPACVYDQLQYLKARADEAGITVEVVTAGDIRSAFLGTAAKKASPPPICARRRRGRDD